MRETLFNILAPRIENSRFLDLCAGSGAVGIEALSRGASEAVFVERSRTACAVIEANLTALGIERATIINQDVVAALKRLEQESRVFDIVFIDPPYSSAVSSLALDRLGSDELLIDTSIVVVEHRLKTPPDPDRGRLRKFREVKQGESALAFYEVEPGR